MDEFTQAEKARINELYATDFEGITPADIPLIQKAEYSSPQSIARYLATPS